MNNVIPFGERRAKLGMWKVKPVAPWQWRAKIKFVDYSGETIARCIASLGKRSQH